MHCVIKHLGEINIYFWKMSKKNAPSTPQIKKIPSHKSHLRGEFILKNEIQALNKCLKILIGVSNRQILLSVIGNRPQKYCTVESILTGCITAWFGNSTAGNRKALQRVVWTARHICWRWASLPPGHLHQAVYKESPEDHQWLQPPVPQTVLSAALRKTSPQHPIPH